jgi:hypothetical protein
MYPLQEQAIFDPARWSVVEASTKSGKTVGCMAWIFEQAWMGPPGVNHWWIAPYYPTARIAYDRLKSTLPPQLFRYNDSNSYLMLTGNLSRIWFKSGEKPDGLYGEDVWSVVMDEATRMRVEAYYAIRTTITKTRAPVRVIGNVKGRKNWAYRLARKAEQGAVDMAYHKITAWDAVSAGVLDAGEIAAAERDLPEFVFRELYLAEPTDDGANPFGMDAIAACVVSNMPASAPVVWGWDLARKQDWTVGIALDAQRRVAGFHRFQKPWPETIDVIFRTTGPAAALLDSTGVGDPVLQELQTKGANFEGYLFTERSKQTLMEGLAIDLQRGDLFIPDNEIRHELEQFEYEYTKRGVKYSAPVGLHDDCVCALALARHALDHMHWQQAEVW